MIVKAEDTVRLVVNGCRRAVPLATKARWVKPNPKAPGSKAHARYRRYMRSTSLAEALSKGAARGDLVFDHMGDLLHLVGFPPRCRARQILAPRVNGRKELLSVAQLLRQRLRGVGLRSRAAQRRAPICHVLSLGSRCVVARILRDLNIRRYMGPFDWVFSSPAMVRDCLRNDFLSFTCPEQYKELLGRRTIFPHHDMRNQGDKRSFERAVERWRCVLKDSSRKLLVMVHPVGHVSTATALYTKDSGDCSLGEVRQLFADLCAKGVRSFDMVVIYLLADSASMCASHRTPKVRSVFDSGGHKMDRLVVLELHCIGRCTGLYLKASADERALRHLIRGQGKRKRRFDLQPDPLPKAQAEELHAIKRRLMGDDVAFRERARAH